MMKTYLVTAVFVLTLVACGDRPAAKTPVTQVAAKVNGGEISVHQINFLLQRAQAIPPAQAEAAKKKVLEGLIDQELIVQQALGSKVDRTPDVALALDVARRDVLVRAYLEQLADSKNKPSANDTQKFYADNPDLFANRKLYRLQEIVFSAKGPVLDRVKEQLAQAKPIEEIVAQLKANGVDVTEGATVKAAEQIPLDILPRIARAKDAQPQLFESADRMEIVTVLVSKSEPMDEAKALPVIEKFLINKQKTDIARDMLKNLRDKAKIEYMGEFVGTKPLEPVEKNAVSSELDIQKGLGGLK